MWKPPYLDEHLEGEDEGADLAGPVGSGGLIVVDVAAKIE